MLRNCILSICLSRRTQEYAGTFPQKNRHWRKCVLWWNMKEMCFLRNRIRLSGPQLRWDMVMGVYFSFLQMQCLAHNLHFTSYYKMGYDYSMICFWICRCHFQYIALFLPGTDFSWYFNRIIHLSRLFLSLLL